MMQCNNAYDFRQENEESQSLYNPVNCPLFFCGVLIIV